MHGPLPFSLTLFDTTILSELKVSAAANLSVLFQGQPAKNLLKGSQVKSGRTKKITQFSCALL
jgi:hypothetical protein